MKRLAGAALALGVVMVGSVGCGGAAPDDEGAGIDASDALDCNDSPTTETSPEITVDGDSVSVRVAPGTSPDASLSFLAKLGCITEKLNGPEGSTDVLVSEGDVQWSGVSATLSTSSGVAIFSVE